MAEEGLLLRILLVVKLHVPDCVLFPSMNFVFKLACTTKMHEAMCET
jgi:hypothetical protein